MNADEPDRSNETGQIAYCSSCGTKIADVMTFCPKCGTSLRITKGRDHRPDVFGYVSLGVVLIVLALTYLRHPIDISLFLNYIQSMIRYQTFIKPPLALLRPTIFFCYVLGMWGVLLTGLRILVQKRFKRALGDLMGGLLAIYYAYLLTDYTRNVVTGRTVFAYFVITIGLVVIGNVIIHSAFPERR